MQVQSKRKPYNDINLTSMIDVFMVLLLIFMILTTAVVQGLKVNLPKSNTAKSLQKAKTKAITISSDGHIALDTVPVTIQELEQRLAAQKAQTPNFPVVVRGDSHTQYQTVMDVLDLLSKLNLNQVGLASQRSK